MITCGMMTCLLIKNCNFNYKLTGGPATTTTTLATTTTALPCGKTIKFVYLKV